MVTQSLKAILKGDDSGLKDSLEDVADAARTAESAIKSLDESLEDASRALGEAASAANVAGDRLDQLSQAAIQSREAVTSIDSELDDLSGSAIRASESVGFVSDSTKKAAGSVKILESQVAQLEEEFADMSREASESLAPLSALSAAELQATASTKALENSLDEAGDEASESAAQMAGMTSVAELLSLRSSALSINVGAFTVALRNLTTQVPLLVASLGNLTAAFAGLGTVIGGVGLGGLALVFGGMLAKAEQLSGPLESSASTLEALQDIAEDVGDIFIEAIQPILNAEGVIRLFNDAVRGTADIVNSIAESIAFAFNMEFASAELQGLGTTLDQLGDAFTDNADAITQAITDVVFILGDDLVSITESVLGALPGFLRRATDATEELLTVFERMSRNLSGFISSLTELGRSIAAGVAPVLDSFFGVVALVADTINQLGSETIATAVKIAALTVAFNRVAGIMGSLLLPLTQAVSGFLKIATNVSNASSALSGFIGIVSSGFESVARMESGIGQLATSLSLLTQPLVANSAAAQRFESQIESLDSGSTSLTDSFTKLRSVLSGFSLRVGGLSSSFDERVGAIDKMSVSGDMGQQGTTKEISALQAVVTRTRDKLRSFGRSIRSVAGVLGGGLVLGASKASNAVGSVAGSVQNFLNNSFRLRNIIPSTASVTGLLERAVVGLFGAMKTTVMMGAKLINVIGTGLFAALKKGIFGVSVLANKLYTGLAIATKAAAESTIRFIGAVLAKASALSLSSIAATVANISLQALAVTVTALTGGLFLLVVAVGSVAAMLAKLGQSGDSSAEIIQNLKSVLTDIGAAVMPAVVAAGNAMLDVFNTVGAVFDALVGSTLRIGQALGLVEEGGAGSLMDLLQGLIGFLVPIIDISGDFVRVMGARLVRGINAATDALVGFIQGNDIDDMLALMIDGVSSLISGFTTLSEIVGTALVTAFRLVRAVATAVIGTLADVLGFFLNLVGLDLSDLIRAFMDLGKFAVEVFNGIMTAFERIIAGIENAWNNTLAGEMTILGQQVSIPKIGGPGDAAKSAAVNANEIIPDASTTAADIAAGGGAVAAATGFGTDQQTAQVPRGGNVTVNEGNTRNIFHQNISADPEDEAQIGRIAKDAMEEANSFKRRQQGSQ